MQEAIRMKLEKDLVAGERKKEKSVPDTRVLSMGDYVNEADNKLGYRRVPSSGCGPAPKCLSPNLAPQSTSCNLFPSL